MIYETLEIVMDQITKFLETKSNDDSILVLENIAKQDDALVTRLKDRVAVSLLNMEEEATLKNIPNTSFKNGKTIYKNNKVNLNLYVLFSANRIAYDKALISISNIVEFFQSKKVFTQVNTPFTSTSSIFDDLKEFKFIVDLYTPTFEQLNYIWGTLGGKSVPSVLYRISIIEIESTNMHDTGIPISNVAGVLKDHTT
ncbi:DUF4255 domain-containing protein [Flavivirga jejuensis]|uniref:DUF4255 domain-containing protein n=1 Tax=Flavivirga jejuensis TaxID=870487 RepID=A0ABT8WQP0_9FLAO|nr:DUF4255 domain-containing protein [Flavivirga jejuensis]MDO5975221.1 DUF4255 domain-containing protein [Flavivirga jejuensis]